MKKMGLFIFGILLLLPIKIYALTGSVSITCDKTELASGNSANCKLSGTSDGAVSSIDTALVLGDNLTIDGTINKSGSWQGSIENDGIIKLYIENNATGTFDIATFKVKAGTVTAATTSKIEVTNPIFGDVNFQENNINATSLSISLVPSGSSSSSSDNSTDDTNTTNETSDNSTKNPKTGATSIVGIGLVLVLLVAGYLKIRKVNVFPSR